MASVTITVADSKANAVAAAVGRKTGTNITDMTAAQKIALVKTFLEAYLLTVWKDYDFDVAVTAASVTARQTSDALTLG